MLAEFGLWLVKTIGGERIKRLFAKRGLQAELRSIKQALADSQAEREALVGSAERLEMALRDRDRLHAEVIRLRVENVALRAELERLRSRA